MIQIHLILEDLELKGNRRDTSDTPDPRTWTVMVRNNVTSVRVETLWSDVVMSAVCALAVGGGEEGFPDEVTVALYQLAEIGMADLPSELRIIP